MSGGMAVKCIFSDLMCEQGSVQEKKNCEQG